MVYDLGLRLKKLREQRGLTQRELANRINKSIAAVSSYELNRQVPPTEVLVSIASVFSVSLDYLVGLEGKREISFNGLGRAEQALLEMLLNEFSMPTGEGVELSEQQMVILQKLIAIFYSRNASGQNSRCDTGHE